jgi:hypothetical protein
MSITCFLCFDKVNLSCKSVGGTPYAGILHNQYSALFCDNFAFAQNAGRRTLHILSIASYNFDGAFKGHERLTWKIYKIVLTGGGDYTLELQNRSSLATRSG